MERVWEQEGYGRTLEINNSSYVFYKTKSWPQTCYIKQSIVNKNPKANFEILWEAFNEFYDFFNHLNIDWEETYNYYRPIINTIISDKMF